MWSVLPDSLPVFLGRSLGTRLDMNTLELDPPCFCCHGNVYHQRSQWYWYGLQLEKIHFKNSNWSIGSVINPRRARAARVTVLGLCVCVCVCVSVCVSVTQHLTLHVIIHATNDSNLPSGGWRSKILSDFLWKCFVAKLEHFLLVLRDESAIFYSTENAHAYEFGPHG